MPPFRIARVRVDRHAPLPVRLPPKKVAFISIISDNSFAMNSPVIRLGREKLYPAAQTDHRLAAVKKTKPSFLTSREENMSNEDDVLDTVLDEREVEIAKAAQRCIVAALDHSRAVSVVLIEEGAEHTNDGSPTLQLPPKILRLFADMLGFLSQGKPVAVIPKEMDLTTQQAAMMLNISRPYLVRMLDAGEIPFHKVGSHRKVTFDDVRVYKEKRRARSLDALRELSEQAQEQVMGY
jgi:excisionase family DNA binding protein